MCLAEFFGTLGGSSGVRSPFLIGDHIPLNSHTFETFPFVRSLSI